jgi:hypothetical protein
MMAAEVTYLAEHNAQPFQDIGRAKEFVHCFVSAAGPIINTQSPTINTQSPTIKNQHPMSNNRHPKLNNQHPQPTFLE